MADQDDEEPGRADELVAALAGGAALTFEPDADEDDDLLPGRPGCARRGGAAEPVSEASSEEIAAELAREAAEAAEDSPTPA